MDLDLAIIASILVAVVGAVFACYLHYERTKRERERLTTLTAFYIF